MVNVCVVRSCINHKKSTKQSGYKMHRFPTNVVRWNQWLENCKRLDLRHKVLKNIRVCSKHFTSDMYKNYRLRTLYPTAVPINFESTVCSNPATVENKSENDSLLEELDSSSTLKKSNTPILESCEMSSNTIAIPKCSEMSTSMCTQTPQLLSDNIPILSKNIVRFSVPELKNKCNQSEEGMNTIKKQILEMLKFVDHFNEVVDFHLSPNLTKLIKNYVKLINKKPQNYLCQRFLNCVL